LCVSETDLFLFESYILFGDDDFSGVVQLEDAPRTGTIENFILGRITTVSANVQEGNKERLELQILLTIKICAMKFYWNKHFSLTFYAHLVTK